MLAVMVSLNEEGLSLCTSNILQHMYINLFELLVGFWGFGGRREDVSKCGERRGYIDGK